jgi:tRNA (cmo5U34)-methyltransferase
MSGSEGSSGSPAFNAAHAKNYADGPKRQVPGFADLQRMTSLLLAERVGPVGQILVLGAGGGLKLKFLADEHADWRFTGIDPSADMLRFAEENAGPHSARIRLVEGYIDAAPEGPFFSRCIAASCRRRRLSSPI